MTQIRDDVIPEDLSAFVRDAADALPSGQYELERVIRRRRSHRRRAVTGLSLVGVIVMAVAVATPLVLRATTVADPAGAADRPAQRLYYYVSPAKGTTGTLHAGDGIEIRLPGGIVEVDGRGDLVARAYLAANAAVQTVVGLPDGGLVALDLRERETDSVEVLTVVAPDGTVRVDRLLGRWDGGLRLAGATADAAYLVRRDQLVRHDLTSGKEQPVAAAGRINKLKATGWSVDSVVADRVLLTRSGGKGTEVTVLGLSGKGESAPVVGCPPGMGKGPNLMLSPDGRHVACYTMVAPPKGEGPVTTRLTVTDISTGKRAYERDFGPEVVLGWYESIAWVDNRTLRFAALQLPNLKPHVYDIGDVLKPMTVTL